MSNAPQPYLPSVLDRLLGSNDATTSNRSRDSILRELREAVRRDLEALLNTHLPWRSAPSGAEALRLSFYEFGIPDFFEVSVGVAAAREVWRQVIEDCLRLNEPRFRTVKVVLTDNAAQDRTLRFHIEAVMYVEPSPERFSFDSTVDPASHTFSIGDSAHGR